MSRIFVRGVGAVSPAGWGVSSLRSALERRHPLPAQPLPRPGRVQPHWARAVPQPQPRPDFLRHARLRRCSPITHYAVAAALEAIGDDLASVQEGCLRLGILVCTMAGCVNYSRRFWEETLRDPATASPVLFPETVFNAPASHVAACLGSTAASHTLVGDEGVFLQGLAVGANWLLGRRADACVVIGAGEVDWVVAEALHLFDRQAIHSDGAGAVYLLPGDPRAGGVELAGITDAHSLAAGQTRGGALRRMRSELPAPSPTEVLFLSATTAGRYGAAERGAWTDWTGPRVATKDVLGEAFVASSAWQCVAACDGLLRREFTAATVSVMGSTQQAIGARFVLSPRTSTP